MIDSFGIVVVAYNPDYDLLKSNVDIFSRKCKEVVIVNNGGTLNLKKKRLFD